MKVLVIEDEVASLNLTNLVVSSDGHEVADARSAEIACTTISPSQSEVILLVQAAPHFPPDPGRNLNRFPNLNGP